MTGKAAISDERSQAQQTIMAHGVLSSGFHHHDRQGDNAVTSENDYEQWKVAAETLLGKYASFTLPEHGLARAQVAAALALAAAVRQVAEAAERGGQMQRRAERDSGRHSTHLDTGDEVGGPWDADEPDHGDGPDAYHPEGPCQFAKLAGGREPAQCVLTSGHDGDHVYPDGTSGINL